MSNLVTRCKPASVSPFTPVAPPRISSGYARLLVSDPSAHGLGTTTPLQKIHHHLTKLVRAEGAHAHEYAAILPQMAFAIDTAFRQEKAIMAGLMASGISVKLLQPVTYFGNRRLAGKVLQHVLQHETTLLTSCSPTHATYLQIAKQQTPANTYAIRIFNTGKGIGQHHLWRGGRKFQTCYQVRNVQVGAGANHLNADELARMLTMQTSVATDELHDIEPLYAWADAKGVPYNPPTHAMQSEQKTGNCTHKAVLAFLRYSLSEVAYTEARACLIEEAAQGFAAHKHPARNMHLAVALQQKAVRARQKACRAAWQEAGVQAAGRAPWLSSTQRARVLRHRAARLRRDEGAAFAISRPTDGRGLSLILAPPFGDSVQSLPIVWRGPQEVVVEGLDGQEGRFASLQALATHLTTWGYCPVALPADTL